MSEEGKLVFTYMWASWRKPLPEGYVEDPPPAQLDYHHFYARIVIKEEETSEGSPISTLASGQTG